MKRRLTGVLLAVVALAVVVGCGTGRTVDIPPSASTEQISRAPLTERQRAENVESFELAWETIRDNHYDVHFNGVDWDAVRDELHPAIVDANSMAEARAVITDMISRLSESHYAVIPADAFTDGLSDDLLDDPATNPADAGLPGTAGFNIAIAGSKAIVTDVSDTVAERHPSIVPGAEVAAVDGKPLEPLLAKLANESAGDLNGEVVRKMAVLDLLNGAVGSVVEVQVESIEGERQLVGIERIAPKGELVRFGNLPPFPIAFDTRV
ncbi:MAG: hypothetical protein AAF656_07860, partial [Planctomycetota bacterium]